jgi:hypothetical protein
MARISSGFGGYLLGAEDGQVRGNAGLCNTALFIERTAWSGEGHRSRAAPRHLRAIYDVLQVSC